MFRRTRITTVEANDGCALVARELRTAPAQAPTVMLVHALAMDGNMWQRVADALTTPARVIAVDCRGHGASGKPAGPYSIRLFAEDLRCVADALGVRRMILGGCSMGGMVAQAFAGAWPLRLEGLMLVDTTAWYGPGAASAWEDRATKALDVGFASLLAFQHERWFSGAFRDAHPEVLAEATDVFLRNDPQAYASTCRMLGFADERDSIAQYFGAATILVGEQDLATPTAMATDLASRIGGARLAVLPGARHFTPFEVPAAIASELESLLAKTRTLEETP